MVNTKDTTSIIDLMNAQANKRNYWIKKNRYYYQSLISFFKYHVPINSSVLEIGSGTGYLLKQLSPKSGVGIDFSEKMVKTAQRKYSKLKFICADAHKLEKVLIGQTFEYIILSDTVGYFTDVQQVLSQIYRLSGNHTRIIITNQSTLWAPLLSLAEKLGLKMPSAKTNWLEIADLENLLQMAGFEVIQTGSRTILPISIPLLSSFANKYLVLLPILNSLGLTHYLIARPLKKMKQNFRPSVSVIIPARNERGNIKNAIKRLPKFSPDMEVVFVEGHSTDGTREEIEKLVNQPKPKFPIKYMTQKGKGKADAVRLGFKVASKDILMILDADLTSPPEDMPKFYQAIVSNRAECVIGSRLVYPMEKEAMQFLNVLGNKFFSLAFSWLLNQKIKDTLCGTKVLTKKNWQRIVKQQKYFGDFDPFGDFDILFGASKLNLKIREIPIRYKVREYGETNISRFKHGLLLLKMVVFGIRKMKFY